MGFKQLIQKGKWCLKSKMVSKGKNLSPLYTTYYTIFFKAIILEELLTFDLLKFMYLHTVTL